jgi:hypothetical protein
VSAEVLGHAERNAAILETGSHEVREQAGDFSVFWPPLRLSSASPFSKLSHRHRKLKAAPFPERPLESVSTCIRQALGKMFRERLAEPGAHFAAVAVQADASAFEKIGDRGDRFTVVAADGADRKDEFAETRSVAIGFFQGLFHMMESQFSGDLFMFRTSLS